MKVIFYLPLPKGEVFKIEHDWQLPALPSIGDFIDTDSILPEGAPECLIGELADVDTRTWYKNHVNINLRIDH